MQMETLVRELNALGIYPFVDGGRLKTRAASAEIPAEVVDRIRSNKDELIRFLSGGHEPGHVAIRAQPCSPRGGPLSFPQQRLWFIDQLEGGSAQYNMPTAMYLNGCVNIAAVERALGEIVRRHTVLRTTYAARDGEPVQTVRDHEPFRLQRIDLTSLPPEDRQLRAMEWALQELDHPFNLAEDPMLRASIATLSCDRHLLILNLHHIACDGWSKGILTQEFVSLYRDYALGCDSSLPELPVQYCDYARWQRSEAFGQRIERQLAYWEQQLADIPALHGLRLDHPRPAQQRFAGRLHVQTLGPALLADLKRLARSANATLFMVLQSAFSVLLGRWSQERTVVIGTPVAGRARRELEPLIGFFVNTLVLKTQLTEGLSFRDLLARCRAVALEAYANQDVPFEMIVERLRPQRSLSHSPLFQILFALQNNDYGTLDLPGVSIEGFTTDSMVNRFDLEVFASERDDGLTLAWNFATSLFEPHTISALAESFEVLLAAAVSAPDTEIYDLPITTRADLSRLAAWRARHDAVPLPARMGAHERFERCVVEHGAGQAVVFDDASLTYAQLNERANRIAHALIEAGAGRDSLIGISVGRSPDLIVSVLAVLKAGAAYVALDPEYPKARLALMLDDSGVSIVLTSRTCSWREPADRGLAWFVDDVARWQGYSAENPALEIDAEQLAYVIYTSGSTGQPKGILLPHRVLTNLVLSQYHRFEGMAEQLATLQFATLNFDMSIYEIMTALCNGSTLVMISDEDRMSLPRLVDVLARHRVGRLYLPTAMLPEFCRFVNAEGMNLPFLKLIQVAGEALTINDDVRRFFARAAGCRLLNLYGPSESHVVTDYMLGNQPGQWPVAPPIGYPVENSRLYVLDSRLREMPIGAVGELYIAGVPLARGYLKRPELTREKFIDQPGVGEARIYRTGDLVHYDRDGCLHYIGRTGRQVKIRGFRVELGEIEHCLLRNDWVTDAVVVTHGEPPDKSLVAYVTVSAQKLAELGAALTDASRNALADELKQSLALSVPAYMIPTFISVLERFELNANGKVDTSKLPAPGPLAGAPFVAPANELERRMVEIWADILRVPAQSLSVLASFFDLGGHSLLAMRLLNRIAESFQVVLPVRSLFLQPTVTGLCREIASLRRSEFRHIPSVDRSAPLPLAFSQQRLWYIDQLEGGSVQYNLPVALRLTGTLDLRALQACFDRIVERHEILRTVYSTGGGGPVQIVRGAQPLRIDRISLVECGGQPSEERLVQELIKHALRPFDLSRDPMIRVTLFEVGESRHVLLCTVHHIAADGWSLGILTKELAALYGAFTRHQEDPLAPMELQYGDFACWQREETQSQRLSDQLEYWMRHLAGIPTVHSLPLDHRRPGQQSYSGDSVRQVLDADLTDAVRKLARRHDATLFMLLKSVFAVVLARWSNEQDIVIGSPIAGRPHRDMESLIGLFVNTLVFRYRLTDDLTFTGLMEQAKQLTLDAFANQDVPFEMLVEVLRPARSLSHAPVFQVQFVLQNNEQVALELPGLSIEGTEIAPRFTKLDLTLSVREIGSQLILHWSYADSLFERETISRMAESFLTLMRAAIASPERSLDTLPLAPARDIERYRAWNRTARDYPTDACIHHLISETARQNARRVAVRQGSTEVTYEQLDTASRRLAGYLRSRGIGAGHRVAVYADRSPQLLVALTGVLKSGAAYVPLDLKNTPQRVQSIVADAGVSLVLSAGPIAGNLSSGEAEVLLLDGCLSADWFAGHDAVALPEDVSSENSAYVIYTSGSTGVPKGVDVPHRGLVEYCTFAAAHYYERTLAGSLVVTSHGFDITVPSLYLPLLKGDCVNLLPPGDPLERLAESLRAPRCDNFLLRMTPMHVQGLLALLPPGFRADARHVFVIGGERFAPEHARRLQRLFPRSTIHNHYGPTETVVGCCMYNVSQNLDRLEDTVPIGRAMSNTELHVLNRARQPVPVGVPGELYIGGDCVANGYINRPELTAERFIAHPFEAGEGRRLYRTGDLVRFDRDGNLVFIGRVDDQIKLRGFRIEPGEIEAQITAVSGVATAVVVAADRGDNRFLAAYLVPEHPLPDAAAEHELISRVREALKRALPEYLNPSAYMCLEKLPLSANGKTDRRALPAIHAPEAHHEATPATVTEARVRRIWSALLGLDADRISTHASFFELGGHSMLAVALIEAIAAAFSKRLPLSAIYAAATIAEQARLLEQGAVMPVSPVVKLHPGAEDNPLFLIHPVGGDVACYRELVRRWGPAYAVYGIQHRGWLSNEALEIRSVEDLARDYAAEIRRIQPSGPYRIAGWSLGGVIALGIAELLERDAGEVAYLGLIDSVLHHDSRAWAAVQEKIAPGQPLSAYTAALDEDEHARAQFDRAYGLAGLAVDQHDVSQHDGVQHDGAQRRAREIILANVIAARTFRGSFSVRRIHYYGASSTAARSHGAAGSHGAAVDGLLAMSREPARQRAFDADHFSLLRPPVADQLARQIATDIGSPEASFSGRHQDQTQGIA